MQHHPRHWQNCLSTVNRDIYHMLRHLLVDGLPHFICSPPRPYILEIWIPSLSLNMIPKACGGLADNTLDDVLTNVVIFILAMVHQAVQYYVARALKIVLGGYGSHVFSFVEHVHHDMNRQELLNACYLAASGSLHCCTNIRWELAPKGLTCLHVWNMPLWVI